MVFAFFAAKISALCSLLMEGNHPRSVMLAIQGLCDLVRQTAYEIHRYHGHGHLEKVYENALVLRLGKKGINVIQQYPTQVYDEDGSIIGDYQIDLLIEKRLILELKAVKALSPEHEAQVLGYLKSTKLEHALLINFGCYRFAIRKFVFTH